MNRDQGYERHPKPDDFKPEKTFGDDHAWKGQNRCTAWAVTKGEQCGQRAMKGKTKCRKHGGKSKSGEDHPNFKHGKYVGLKAHVANGSDIPYVEAVKGTRWEHSYGKYLGTSSNISLASDIALNQARIDEQIKIVDSATDTTFLNDLETVVDEIKEAMSENNLRGLAQGIVKITDMIEQARKDRLGQVQLDKLINQRMALTTRQQRMIKDSETLMPATVVMNMMTRVFNEVCNVIEKHVGDEALTGVIFDESSLRVRDVVLHLSHSAEVEE